MSNQDDGNEGLPDVPGPTEDDAKILEPSPDAAVDTGTKEAALLTRGKTEKELKKEAALKEHDRSQKFKDHFERIAIGLLWIAAASLLVIFMSWLWHMVTPSCLHYLDSEQLAKLQYLFTGGIVVGVVSGHLKKRLT